ncbi:DUF3631 domain-containing protein [Streptacidiphilus griseoplanus]|uniref:DUF3631 domain-containing protein n=1 Tax=Peterkaempfera griseoplana TaxID=66896 RepID=UPI0006E41045|nr:DUF3631 domain-containing protein [Peterkaempfera griseoplana]
MRPTSLADARRLIEDSFGARLPALRQNQMLTPQADLGACLFLYDCLEDIDLSLADPPTTGSTHLRHTLHTHRNVVARALTLALDFFSNDTPAGPAHDRTKAAKPQHPAPGSASRAAVSRELLEECAAIFDAFPSHEALPTSNLLELLNDDQRHRWSQYDEAGLTARDLSLLLGHYGIGPRNITYFGRRLKVYLRSDIRNALLMYVR